MKTKNDSLRKETRDQTPNTFFSYGQYETYTSDYVADGRTLTVKTGGRITYQGANMVPVKKRRFVVKGYGMCYVSVAFTHICAVLLFLITSAGLSYLQCLATVFHFQIAHIIIIPAMAALWFSPIGRALIRWPIASVKVKYKTVCEAGKERRVKTGYLMRFLVQKKKHSHYELF